MKTTLMMALAASLALSAGAFAQSATQSAQSSSSQDTTGSNSANDSSYNSANRNTNTGTNDSTSMTSSTESFDQLDTNHRGYLKKTDLASNKQMSARFSSCDKNHDGRITHEEYDACMTTNSSSNPKY